MAHFVFGRDDLLLEWAARQVPHMHGGREMFGAAKAIGICTGPDLTDRLLAVVAYHCYDPIYRTCQVSAVASSPRWATRRNLREVLAFPFLQYGCNVVWTATPHTLSRVIGFNKAIGFRQEATLAERFGPGLHAVICRMTLKDYRRIYLDRERSEEPVSQKASA